MTLHERIAEALGWTLAETHSFSLATLRECVRHVNPKLATEIDAVINTGSHIVER